MDSRAQPVVLHVLGTAQPAGAAVAKIVASLADHLSPDRYRFHACFIGGDGPLAANLRRHGVTVDVIEWDRGVRDPAGAFRFAACLRRSRASIVHQHYGGRSVSWLAKRVTGAPLVFHVHGAVDEYNRPCTIRTGSADAVIANSRATATAIRHSGVTVIYPGIDIGARTEREDAPRTDVIGSAGRLEPIKGTIYLIEAFALLSKELPSTQLEIAGLGSEFARLDSQVRRFGLERRVKFLGWLDDLSAAFARWEIFVQPSLAEGFGLSILEAMAQGLPVVASEVGGAAELVVHGTTGLLVPPREPEALAAALRELLRDKAWARGMGSCGRIRAEKSFSAFAEAANVAEIYESVIRLG